MKIYNKKENVKVVEEMKNVVAVVSTFNRKRLLRLCLTALLKQMPPSHIIVVDGPSTDGTDKMIKKEFPSVIYVRIDQDIGGSGQFYVGLKLAYEMEYEWIWVMDDDVIIGSNGLKKILKIIDDAQCKYGERSIGAVVPSYLKNGEVIKPISIFAGGLIKRDVITEIGLPRYDFFIVFDDTEYFYRIKKAGYNIIYAPPNLLYHVGMERLYKGEMNVRFLGKHFKVYASESDKRMFYFFRNGIVFTKQLKDYKWLHGLLRDAVVWSCCYVAYLRRYKTPLYAFLGLIEGLMGITGKRI